MLISLMFSDSSGNFLRRIPPTATPEISLENPLGILSTYLSRFTLHTSSMESGILLCISGVPISIPCSFLKQASRNPFRIHLEITLGILANTA